MTFEQLNYFLEVVKDMNYTKAANRLFISQSTLSRHITALEESLGASLLTRDTHSVKLTEAGAFLVHEGRELLKKKNDIEETIWRLNESVSERVSLIMYPMLDNRIYHLCNKFKTLHSDVMLNLSMLAYSEDIIDEIGDGAADIGIATSCELGAMRPDVECVTLWQDNYYLIVPNDHELAQRASVSSSDVAGERILIADEPSLGSALCASIHNYLVGSGGRKREVMQPKNLTEMTMQVRAGMGLAILPGVNCRRDEGYRALPITGVPTQFDVVMLWKKDNPNNNTEKLRQFILDCFSGEADKE